MANNRHGRLPSYTAAQNDMTSALLDSPGWLLRSRGGRVCLLSLSYAHALVLQLNMQLHAHHSRHNVI
jgi:hypothetical protein